MRRPLLVGNWKMNTALDDALRLAAAAAGAADRLHATMDIGVCPPFPWIVPIAELLKQSTLTIGAQDVSAESDGAFTGDVSAAMLSPWCQFVLVGHSERRTVHGESDDVIARKVRMARDRDLGVILCVGETEGQRASGHAESTVTGQIESAMKDAPAPDGTTLTIAYEPVWAIGTGRAATVDDAQAMSAVIRGWLRARHGAAANDVRLLYGGSVTDDNIRDFLVAPDIDGALVGSASLDPDRFTALIDAAIDPG